VICRSISRHNAPIDHNDVVGVVVDSRQPNGVAADRDDADAKRSSLSRVDIEKPPSAVEGGWSRASIY
jgi:hypothetical protein